MVAIWGPAHVIPYDITKRAAGIARADRLAANQPPGAAPFRAMLVTCGTAAQIDNLYGP